MALANLIGSPVEKATLTALHAVEGRPLNTPQYQFETISVPRDQLEKYVGRYVSGEGVDISVDVVDAGLMLASNTEDLFGREQESLRLRPIDEHHFITEREGNELTVSFVVDEAGVAEAISLYYRIFPKVVASEGSRT